MIIFEVTAVAPDYLTISLEHPFDESIATIEFHLIDFENIECKAFCGNKNMESISITLSKILMRSMSLPVALRSLIKYWEDEDLKQLSRSTLYDNGNFDSQLEKNDPGGGSDARNTSILNNGTTAIENDFINDIKNQTGNNGILGSNNTNRNIILASSNDIENSVSEIHVHENSNMIINSENNNNNNVNSNNNSNNSR